MLLSGQSSGKSKDWSERPEDISDQSFLCNIFMGKRTRICIYQKRDESLKRKARKYDSGLLFHSILHQIKTVSLWLQTSIIGCGE